MLQTAPKHAQIMKLPLPETDGATKFHSPDWKKAA
jgi:hypothetical protein